MTTRESYRDSAIAALADRGYERAGNQYTRAAWQALARPRDDVDPFELDRQGWVGQGLEHMLVAAASYRVADRDARATRRGVEGVAVARDLATDAGSVQAACLDEFVADFRAIGGLDGVGPAYESAAEAYRTAGSDIDEPRRWATTPLFEAAAAPFQQLARSRANGEIAVTWEDLHGSDPGRPGAFLAHRAEYKRQRLPGLVDAVVADGYLAAPRGTTAYDTDSHRCPACDSRDVNWVGSGTLCLRCSRPTRKT